MGLKRLGAVLAVTTALAVVASTGAVAQLKVGFVYVGPISDHGWTYRHDVGRLAIDKAFGNKVKTSYVETVKEGADAECDMAAVALALALALECTPPARPQL